MTNNITKQEIQDKTTKLFAMYKDLYNKAMEEGSLEIVDVLYNELLYFKPLLVEAEKKRKALYIEALDGKEEGEINRYKVTYMPLSRKYVDPKKVDEIKDKDLKSLFFKKKVITNAEAEKIILENKIDINIFSVKIGNRQLKFK